MFPRLCGYWLDLLPLYKWGAALSSSDEKRLAIWRSRRGMLELDLLLTPFIESKFDDLSEAHREQLASLLELDDVFILELMRNPSSSDTHQEIVQAILAFRTNGLNSD